MGPEYYINGLIQRGMPDHIAKGFVANYMAESRLDPGVNEEAPTVAGSRGGFGLYQLTGPRRRQYEAYASQRGVALDDPDAQMDFMMEELQTTEKSAWSAIQTAKDPVEAARLVSERFLRPGTPHIENRLNNARRLAGVPTNSGGADAGRANNPSPIERNPLRLAWARRTGKMTPEDAALYDKGVEQGVFKQPAQQPDPLAIYQQVAQRPQRPMSAVPLQNIAMPAKWPGLGG